MTAGDDFVIEERFIWKNGTSTTSNVQLLKCMFFSYITFSNVLFNSKSVNVHTSC